MPSSKSTEVLLINGTVGVGKSAVADCVYETLKQQNLPIALISLDELGYANVDPDDYYKMNLRFRNLAAVWPNYARAGVNYLVIPYVIENAATTERFNNAIPGIVCYVALLEASGPVLRQRLSQRLLGGDLEWHLNRTEKLAGQLHEASFHDTSIVTDHTSIQQTADLLIAGWRSRWDSLEAS